ncbi:MAG: transglutaminase-like domain-containing protein [Planctomycetaceae bacterium]|nr:transglutaminase-like domain-containing protein [Planctomycetaceae bacterium]
MIFEKFCSRVLFCSLVLLSRCLVAGSTGGDETDYLAILLQGQKVGYAVHTRTVEGDRVTTCESFSMTLGRGGQAVKVTSKEAHVETTEGKPLSFEMSMVTSGVEQKTIGTISDGTIQITKEAAGQTQTQTAVWPQGALMSEGMRLLQVKRGLTPGDVYDVQMFRPDLLSAVRARVHVGEPVKIDLFGRVLDLKEVKVTTFIQGQQIEMTSYVDANYKAMKTLVPMMGMTMEMVACDKNFAMREDDIVDFLERLSISSPTQLVNAGGVSSITYELHSTADKPLSVPNTTSQTVVRQKDRILVTVNKNKIAEKAVFPYKGSDPNILDALEPTEYIQSDDPKVIDLSRHAIGGTQDAATAVKQIESFVAGYIQQKDLSVGYASAGEVAQSRQGDCSEHAVLVAGMCRAVGIPARVVCGLVYAESFGSKKSIFGGHMWVEAYVGDDWVGLDATRVSQDGSGRGFGPDHIALAIGNGDPTDFFSLVNTLGYFSIENITVKK